MSIELFHGDCLEVMKELPDRSIDLFMCDLPYGCLKTNQKDSLLTKKGGRTFGEKNLWDVVIPWEPFWKEIRRLRKNAHSVVLFFCQGKFMVDALMSNREEFVMTLVWDKKILTNYFNAGLRPCNNHEQILVFAEKSAYYNRINYEGKCPTTIIRSENLQKIRKSGERWHPSQKPVDLYKRLISWYCPPGGTVLDPTAGSCASIIAAGQLGMNAIGIEKSDEYYEKAVKRLEELDTEKITYNIAIPSYNRAEVLNTKTLPMLKEYNIDKSKITVFVANKEEEAIYESALDKSTYGKIVVGEKGVMAIRNFITNYYPKDSYVISLDDDIESFDKLFGNKDKSGWEPIKSFKTEMIAEGYKLMNQHGYHVWGIYSNRNNGFASSMKPVSTDLKFLIGHCFGFINKKVFTHIDYKEDYERSIEYAIKDGGVIRFNHICAKTKFGIPGGVNKTAKERVSTYHKEVEYLIGKYPKLVRKNPRREGEILLARTVN